MTPISYEAALGALDGNSTQRFLENVAAGRYWHEGTRVDPPELQAKKAAVILQELTHQIAQLPDPNSLPNDHCGKGSRTDVQAQIMLLRLDARWKFDEVVTKKSEPLAESPVSEPQPNDPSEPQSASPVDKLKAAKEATRDLKF